MALISLALSAAALLCMLLGLVFALVPWLGAVLSFLAPALALGAVVCAGLALAGRPAEQSGGFAAFALVCSVLALIPSLLFAFTCGMCSACLSAASESKDGQWSWQWSSGNPKAKPAPPVQDPMAQVDAGTGEAYRSVDGGPRAVFPPPPLDAPPGGAVQGQAAPQRRAPVRPPAGPRRPSDARRTPPAGTPVPPPEAR
ncbi:MAG: hypothetical protein ACPGUV_09490 [Polyangiales bacterium]